MLSVVVYATDVESFNKSKSKLEILGMPSEKIIFADSNKYTRLNVLNKNLNKWLLFLDYDCELSKSNFELLLTKIRNYSEPGNIIFAGVYENPVNCTAVQLTHNFIANTWLLQSYEVEKQRPLFLGGAFVVRLSTEINTVEPQIWGAEDKWLAYLFNDKGFKFHCFKDLKISHNTSSSFKHFFRRAYLHGKNEAKYIFKNENKTNYLYWLRKIDFLNPSLILLLALHFCVQKGAKLFQKVLQ